MLSRIVLYHKWKCIHCLLILFSKSANITSELCNDTLKCLNVNAKIVGIFSMNQSLISKKIYYFKFEGILLARLFFLISYPRAKETYVLKGNAVNQHEVFKMDIFWTNERQSHLYSYIVLQTPCCIGMLRKFWGRAIVNFFLLQRCYPLT